MAVYYPTPSVDAGYPANIGRGLTLDERADIADAFDGCADASDGGSGTALSRHGLSCAMISLLGYKPATVRATSPPCPPLWQPRPAAPPRYLGRAKPPLAAVQFETKTLFAQHSRPVSDSSDGEDCSCGTAGVSLPAFEAIMAQKYRFQDADEKCRQAFRQFDHGKGYITIDDAHDAFREAAPSIPDQTVRDVFHEADSGGLGKVGYKEFHALLNSLPAWQHNR